MVIILYMNCGPAVRSGVAAHELVSEPFAVGRATHVRASIRRRIHENWALRLDHTPAEADGRVR
jgi:hypothetical protein